MSRDSRALSASCIGFLLALSVSNTAVAVSLPDADGKALYVSEGCAGCHGAGGQGGMGKKLATDAALGDIDAVLHRIIFGGNGMPPFGETLSNEQVVSLADYLRTSFGNDFGATQKARVDAVRKAGPGGIAAENGADTNGVKPGGIAVGAPSLQVRIPTSGAPSQEELDGSAESVESWLMYNKSYDGQRYSSLTQINARNAARLEVQCVAQLGIQTSFNAMPLVYAGVMYVTAANKTFAFDAHNCRQLWQHVYTAKDVVQYDANRGVAIYEGRLFRGTSDAHVIALDVKTGTLLWDVRPADSATGYFFSAAPIAWNDTLFLGTAGADWGAPGVLFAFNVKDGTTRWSLSEIDGTTFGGSASGATGGGANWSSFTLDTANGKLYVPVGNPAPDLDARHRPGKNLYTDSVIVVDAKTGALEHYYQQVPNDSHDYDTAATPVIFHLPRSAVRADATRYRKTGAPENIDFSEAAGESAEARPPASSAQSGPSDLFMAVGSKEGHVSLYNDTRRELMYRVPVTSIEDSRLQPTRAGVHTCPGTVGGVEWYGPAFDPIYRRMYVGAVDWCARYAIDEARYVRGQIYMGGKFEFDPVEKSRGWITSIDVGTGRLLWKYQSELPVVASVTPTAGDVLLTGELTGNFLVLDESSGQKLYSFYTGGPVAGGIATYAVDGHQYVAVPSGNMSRSFSMDLSPSATVFLFALREPQTDNH